MNKNYKYIFPKTSKKEYCCVCGKRTFKALVDRDTLQPVGSEYGRCERIYSCGYSKYPSNPYNESTANNSGVYEPLKSEFEDYSIIESTKRKIRSHHDSRLFEWFVKTFGKENSQRVFSMYKVASYSDYYDTLFWQIDAAGHKRGGKLFQYSSETGKRQKKEDGHPIQHWVHSLEKVPDFKLKQCFFGQHLLTEKPVKVGIVEAEKTALAMSILMPEFVWLATGGIYMLGALDIDCIRNKEVYLYPDAAIQKYKPNGIPIKTPFQIWLEQMKKIENEGVNIYISDLLENKITQEQRKEGFDLLDYFLSYSEK